MTMNNNSIKYFDLQVNGYAGVDFNSLNLTLDQMERVCDKLTEDNVEGILVTIITDDIEKMVVKIKNVSELIESRDRIKNIIRDYAL